MYARKSHENNTNGNCRRGLVRDARCRENESFEGYSSIERRQGRECRHCHHRQHVIEARDRMAKARKESNRFAFLRVGEGGLRQRGEHGGKDDVGMEFLLHIAPILPPNRVSKPLSSRYRPQSNAEEAGRVFISPRLLYGNRASTLTRG